VTDDEEVASKAEPVRDALAQEVFVQDKLAKGRVMYFRDPKTGEFSEVPFTEELNDQ
jgi:hypothetical protein